MSTATSVVPVERIEQTIIMCRGEKVMLDEDLAVLYGVSTKRLNEQVKRNAEVRLLRSQSATAKRRRGGRRTAPYVFTEHGAVMLASVLNSRSAVQASIHVVRAFVRLRRLLASHAELGRKLEALEKKYDSKFRSVFEAIRALMEPPARVRREVGFRPRRNTPGGSQVRSPLSGQRLR